MAWWIVLLILLAGWLLVFLEVFIIPGTTVFAVIGAITMITGVVIAYANFGALYGTITLIATAVFTLISIVYGFKSGLMKGFTLSDTVEGKMNEIDLTKIKVGDTGAALSKIAPFGKGLFNENTFEVQTLGEWIAEGSPIEVIKISLGKIYVKAKA